MFSYIRRDAVISLRNTACDGGKCIAVPADGYGISYGIFKSCGLEEGHECLRDGLLAGFIKLVAVPNAVQRKIHGIVILVDEVPYLQDIFPAPRHIESHHRSFRTF